MADNSNYTNKPTTAMLTNAEVDALINGRTMTNELINLAELSFAEWLSSADSAQQALYQTCRDYYDGVIGFTLTDRMKEFFELKENDTYSFNFIPLAIDTIQERMAIKEFEVAGEDDTTPDEKRQGGKDGRLMQWFDFSRMDARQDDIHHATLVDGDAFIIVDWDADAQMPVITVHPAYVSTLNKGSGDGVYVAYKEENQNELKFAVRSWRIETGPNKGNTRLNVYTDDGIYKYITGGRGYVPFIEDGQPWPIPWINPKTNQPIEITVIHFNVRESLVKSLITFQDSINKTSVDEMAGADIEGFSMITLSGGLAPVDDEGNSTVEVGPRRILHAQEGTWGSIGAGDLAGLSMMTDKAIQRLAQRARIPLKYFQISGQVSSADSQNADDSGMVSLIEGVARRIGNAWEDVMDACRRVHNAFGPAGDELDESRITAVWQSFERVNRQDSERTKAETLDIRSQTFERLLLNSVDREQAALQAGYSAEEAAKMAVVSRGNLDGSITQ